MRRHAGVVEEVALAGGLDALGDDLHAGIVADPSMPRTIAWRVLQVVDAADQRHVELDQVRLEIREQREPGVAGAEIVDGGEEAAALVLPKDLGEPGAVFDPLALGHLEDDLLEREVVDARGLERSADAASGLRPRWPGS